MCKNWLCVKKSKTGTLDPNKNADPDPEKWTQENADLDPGAQNFGSSEDRDPKPWWEPSSNIGTVQLGLCI